jgi:hypothetical protein
MHIEEDMTWLHAIITTWGYSDRDPSENNLCPSRNSDWISPECKSEKLPLETAWLGNSNVDKGT